MPNGAGSLPAGTPLPEQTASLLQKQARPLSPCGARRADSKGRICILPSAAMRQPAAGGHHGGKAGQACLAACVSGAQAAWVVTVQVMCTMTLHLRSGT